MLLTSVQNAALAERPFEIVYDSKTHKKTVRILSPLDLVNRANHAEYHAKRNVQIVKVFNQALENMPRLPIADAMEHPTLNAARKFLRTLDPQSFQEKHVERCSRLILAAKLGLRLEDFDNNPGFEDFAFKSHLDRYLLHYEHNLKFGNGHIYIPFEGHYMPWFEVYEQWKEMEAPKPNFPGNPKQEWNYGPRGIQKKDMYAWTKLEPYKIEKDHDWGDRYIFELCVCCNKEISMTGDHTWMRLKTPKGEIYSIGLYRQGKTGKTFFDNVDRPMRVKKGYLMSPDVSEFWPMPTYRIPVKITEKQFHAIKASIEEDKKNEETRVFQLFKENCTEYAMSKAALGNITLPTSIHYLENVSPVSLQEVGAFALHCIPDVLRMITILALTILSNLLQLILGAHLFDEKLKGKNITFKPHINSLWDLFDTSKLYFHPPRHLGLNIRQKIEHWRETEIKEIEALPIGMNQKKWEIEEMRYKLPPQFKK